MIGDVLTSTILCDNLKKEFPGSEVHYMVHSHTLPVILNHPSVDRVIEFTPHHRASKTALFQLISELNKEGYHAVIDVYTKLETNLICLMLKIGIKIGYHKWYSAMAYNHPVKRWKSGRHNLGLTLENRLQLLQPLIPGKSPDQLLHKPKIYLTEEERAQARDLLTQNGLDKNSRPWMISILGSGPEKSYPAAYMAAVLDELARQSDAPILFNYIPKQLPEVSAIYDRCLPETRERIVMDCFAASLRGFIALLSQCRALIGNEGGAVNMAKALELPTFSIFAPQTPKSDWALFEDEHNRSVHLKDHRPELFEGVDSSAVKKGSEKLYMEFKPEYFIGQLDAFIKTH